MSVVGKVKSILITQQDPGNDKSPYFELSKKYKLKIDYRPFIHVEGVNAQDFRQQRVDLLEHSAVIFTSRNAVDHYFRMAKELRVTVPNEMKYFCQSEAIAFYLQKYILYRKRKISYANGTFSNLLELVLKNKTERFLLPCSNLLNQSIPQSLDKENIVYSRATMFKTVCSDLSDLADVKYDMLVFFSPSDIESLFKNFPKFKQGGTRIAIFGNSTAVAAGDAKLRIDILAPSQKAPSMSSAIEQYIQENK